MTTSAVSLDKAHEGPPRLTVSGVLAADGAVFGLGFALIGMTPAQDDAATGVRWLAADLIDAGGTRLITSAISARPLCTSPNRYVKSTDDARYLVSAAVPLVKHAARLIVRDEKQTLLDRAFPKTPPTVGSVQPKALGGGTFEVSWAATHPEGAAMEHVVLARPSPDFPWLPLSLPSSGAAVVVTPSPPLGSTHVWFAVMTTDGLHTVLAEAGPVDAPPAKPQVAIMSPAAGPTPTSLLLYGASTHAIASDSGAIAVWESSVDGTLATGLSSRATLSSGPHTVTLRLIDRAKTVIAQDTVDVTAG